MVCPGDNCLVEWTYDAEEKYCRLGWSILNVENVKSVKKILPTTLCIELNCNDKMYWVFLDEYSVNKKYEEIVGVMNR